MSKVVLCSTDHVSAICHHFEDYVNVNQSSIYSSFYGQHPHWLCYCFSLSVNDIIIRYWFWDMTVIYCIRIVVCHIVCVQIMSCCHQTKGGYYLSKLTRPVYPPCMKQFWNTEGQSVFVWMFQSKVTLLMLSSLLNVIIVSHNLIKMLHSNELI